MDICIEANENNVVAQKLAREFRKELRMTRTSQSDNVQELIKHCIQVAQHRVSTKLAYPYFVLKRADPICETSCAFCFQPFAPRQHARQLSCGHIFHRKCVDKALLKLCHTTCPCCSRVVC